MSDLRESQPHFESSSPLPASDRSISVLVGVIGGSGLYALNNLTFVKQVNPQTPWGLPSSPVTIFSLPSGTLIAFLARHGAAHTISPSLIPYRANIAALKSLGVKVILAFGAVGSLREDIPPGTFALPTQIIDRTQGLRPSTYFDSSVVAHTSFGDPFSVKLVKWLEGAMQKALVAEEGRKTDALVTDKCIVCMEGPAFSTRAESLMYRQWGGDLITMTVVPEAKLAREVEISYALIATVTDYDSWRPESEALTASEVHNMLVLNAQISRRIAVTILEDLCIAAAQGDILSSETGSMKRTFFPKPEWLEADKEKLSFILPEYFAK